MTVQRRDRRAQIVAAAYRAIAREGVAAISTRKIAGEAGINLGTLHSLFGSKDALLVAVLDHVTGRMIEALAPPAQARPGLDAALAETSAALWALADQEPHLPLVRCDLLLYLLRCPTHVGAASAQQERYLAALADRYRQSHADTDSRGACEVLAHLVASQLDGLALYGAFLAPATSQDHFRVQARRAVTALLKEDVLPTGTTPRAGNGITRDRASARSRHHR